MFKTCTKCNLNLIKDTGFYPHAKTKDGFRSECKSCTKISAKEWQSKNSERERDRSAKWAKDNPDKAAAKVLRYQKRNPEVAAAHIKANSAIKHGSLIKQPCEVCGSTTKIHAHHDDYSKPMEVRWLCQTHHVLLHKAIRLG